VAEREAEEAEGVQRWMKGKSPRADLKTLKAQGSLRKLKILTDLKIK
jgi:hypothetical protein